jgi:hypothetical protein
MKSSALLLNPVLNQLTSAIPSTANARILSTEGNKGNEEKENWDWHCVRDIRVQVDEPSRVPRQASEAAAGRPVKPNVSRLT